MPFKEENVFLMVVVYVALQQSVQSMPRKEGNVYLMVVVHVAL
eukprot:CAMPEP_0194310404 /NCGR_PEP_ID=MMETSP0171-20130528/7360_1 /TAXON_ID=218684 /ORGANISM="Corethron pennatum, Strain L29A3" /LENGTH=42 /DNA_ID= /DNA_START= /DNA_END= /DNA_ORIENTATION=